MKPALLAQGLVRAKVVLATLDALLQALAVMEGGWLGRQGCFQHLLGDEATQIPFPRFLALTPPAPTRRQSRLRKRFITAGPPELLGRNSEPSEDEPHGVAISNLYPRKNRDICFNRE